MASASLGTFHEPSRRWWQPRRVAAANKKERAELAELEGRLSLEEVAHFRAGVAAIHSSHLAPSYAILQVPCGPLPFLLDLSGAIEPGKLQCNSEDSLQRRACAPNLPCLAEGR